MWSLLWCFAVVSVVAGFENNSKTLCHFADPNVVNCIQRVAEQAKQLLAQGVPSLNIQPLDPLKIPSIRLRQHNVPQSSFEYDAWLTDVVIEGLTNYTFITLDVFPEELKVTANISMPHVILSSHYAMIGEFQMLPIVSTGKIATNVFGGFVCPREEKALGRCLRDALNAYIPQLATGLPEYGIPPCEPMIVPALSIQQATGPISVMSSFSDVTVRGPASMRVKQVEVDSAKHQVVAKLFIPELRMKGNYRLTGQLLMLPIDGEGQFSAKYGDIDAIVTIVLGRQPRRNDVDALTCEHLNVNFHVETASMKLENLFGGDGDLSNAMNQFLNENWEKLAEELQGPLEEALRDFLKPLADHAFSTLNADDILSS